MKEIGNESANGDFEEFSLEEEPPPGYEEPGPAVRFPHSEVQCPSCGTSNPADNRHCEECGARLSQGPLPVAPRPAVQATAGVRAAMAIAAILAAVAVIALLFNIFTGDDTATETTVTSTTTTSTTPEPGPIEVLSVNCSVPGIVGFECLNLIDGGEGEYQINWEMLPEGQKVTIDLIFAEPMVVTSFVWENLPEGDRFFQNYRAQAISVVDGTPNAMPLTITLDDQAGLQSQRYASLRTLKLSITIETAYLPQERNGQIFTELAIKGIQPMGYPFTAAEPAETTTTTTGG